MNVAQTHPATDGSRAQFAPVLPVLPDNGKPVARLHFDSLADIAALIPDRNPRGSSEHWTKKNQSFYGASMMQALDMARNGWREGAERARPLMDRVKIERPTRRSITRYAIAGAVPSVPRYLAGNPLHMKTHERKVTTQSPVVTLIGATSAPWYVSADLFMAQAVAASAIVDRLEDAGFRVEVIAGRRESSDPNGAANGSGANNKTGHRAEMFFRAKAAQDSLDLDRVVFGLGHPAAHRRLLFAIGEIHPDYDSALTGCQGYAVGFDNLERPPGTYILPGLAALYRKEIKDPVAVFDNAIEHLRAQGCPGLE